MPLTFVKRVSDPIHGTIGLTEPELQVIKSRAFQRLRNIKQLGLAHYLYPGSDYSRFSHSLGVCHIAGRTFQALQREVEKVKSGTLTDEDVQDYRLAGLCHDIGHYPFSHAMEHALDNNHSSQMVVRAGTKEKDAKAPEEYIKHESVGKKVLTLDPELQQISGINWDRIGQIFTRERPHTLHPFDNVISSDLDSDRIDYLMRTAHHTGLPYGNVDIEYLLSQVTVDGNNEVCFRAKALRAAEHLLLCRYFDYQQVAFHKTVAGLEWLLKDVLGELLTKRLIRCSEPEVIRKIKSAREWYSFDDGHVVERIRDLRRDTNKQTVRWMCDAILHRAPPKVVGEVEYIGERAPAAHNAFQLSLQVIDDHLDEWAKQFSIPRRLWHVWHYSGSLTKVGAKVPISEAVERGPGGKVRVSYEQALRIRDAQGDGSTPIMNIPYSLMSVLADHTLYALRVYVLFPPGKESLRDQIKATVRRNSHLNWK